MIVRIIIGAMLTFPFFVSDDINECSQSPAKCGNGQRCENYPGTYRCYCKSPGTYLENGDCRGICKDSFAYYIHFNLELFGHDLFVFPAANFKLS